MTAPLPAPARVAIALVGALFGVVTLFAGGSVLLDLGDARASHGQYVPFVLWFNFLSGFVYLGAGAAIATSHRWSLRLSAGLVVAITLVGIAFAAHIASGGAYERETVVAMTIRWGVWAAISGVLTRWPVARALTTG